jgi:hypothetical protein
MPAPLVSPAGDEPPQVLATDDFDDGEYGVPCARVRAYSKRETVADGGIDRERDGAATQLGPVNPGGMGTGPS